MLLGLFVSAVTAIVMVRTSKSAALKRDFKRKVVSFYKVRPLRIVAAVAQFLGMVLISILISLLFGQSTAQFAFTDFSISIGGSSAFLTIALAAAPAK